MEGKLIEQGFLSGELLDGKYRVETLLGEGGMGAVYRATHLGTKRTVAIKVIRPAFSNNEEFVARFRREAEAAGRLRHPNVVDVTDFGFAQTNFGRVAYLVMEYLDGCTLAEVLAEERRLPLDWVVDILEQVCSAVDEAHRLGIIHRDLKPDNIWLEPNRRGGYTIKVLDFGLVKLGVSALPEIGGSQAMTGLSAAPVSATAVEAPQAEAAQSGTMAGSVATESPTLIASPTAEEAATLIQKPAPLPSAGANEPSVPVSPAIGKEIALEATPESAAAATGAVETVGAAGLTRINSVIGTPLYMSPEQCRGERLDARSDIYSLGVIAYRMLCGETPFTGSLDELVKRHTTCEPPPVREKNPKVPGRVARLVMSALAKNPAARPESAAGFASALRASAEGSGTLLRQAVSLYSERFPTFLKISLLAYAPLVATIALLELSNKVVLWKHLTHTATMIIALLLVFGIVIANLLAYSLTSALTAPLVIQLMIAPLRPLRIRTAFATLRRRWRAFSAISIAVMALILVGAALFVLPGVVAAVCFVLCAPVAVMEKSGVRATLRRATRLMRRSWNTVLFITILQFMLPVLVWVASTHTSFRFKLDENFHPKEFAFNVGFSDHSPLYQLLNVFITPLTAIMTALLYLKTRRAGGESLKGAIEQFDDLEIPRSTWQARMRNRSASPAPIHSPTAEK